MPPVETLAPRGPIDESQDHRICGPIDQLGGVVQLIRCPDDHLSGISIRFGIHCRPQAIPIVVELFEVDEHHVGPAAWPEIATEALASCTIEPGELIDNAYHHVYFPNFPNSKGALFALRLTSPAIGAHESPTAFVSRGEERIAGHGGLHTRDGLFVSHGLQARLIFSSPETVASSPPGLLYSPLTSCNMNCTHCISRHSRKRAVRMSSAIKDEIKGLVAAGKITWMFTDYSGDLLFADHKKPGELDYVTGLGIAVHIDTNGAYLTDERIAKIMASKVDAVSISIDAATDETYQTIRIGAPHLDTIFDAAARLVEARARHGRDRNLVISLGFTLMRSNIHELPRFVERAAQAGVDTIGCRHLEVYHAPMLAESLVHEPERFNAMRRDAVALAETLGVQLNIGEEFHDRPGTGSPQPCLLPWETATVLANGDVMACCVPGAKIGNLTEDTLEGIWTGERYRRLRQRINSSDPPELCRSCQFRNAVNRYGAHNSLNRDGIPTATFDDDL
ncbi:radical SAM/SPASM domain-containing protein [Methylobacterium sp. SyP6R]|uniref:radical SAM/SPASM domain-containing protein n=1 Tax=Methylobacterium sp. SyP6R TaxID=2718876 RepID=UPI001F1F7AEC|nr:radical SAM protein [Methylobacterium sp. SyP6R]MCF4127085.1 radical SAM protein [Methylobacterium sp. SyP6R]